MKSKRTIFPAIAIAGVICLLGLSSAAIAGDAPTVADTPPAVPVVDSVPRVQVFQFTALGGPVQPDWTGRAIAENLQTDVSHTRATLVLPAFGSPPVDDAIAAAKQNHADLAVTGTYQMVGDQIRVNGHLIEVATNKELGGFSATGAKSDLFSVEDALGQQLRELLPRPLPPLQTEQVEQSFDPPIPTRLVYQDPGPTYIQPSTVNYYYLPAPAPDYCYPSYPSSFGFSYGYSMGFYPRSYRGVYGGLSNRLPSRFSGSNSGFRSYDFHQGGTRGYFNGGFSVRSNIGFSVGPSRGMNGINRGPVGGRGSTHIGGNSVGGGGRGGRR